MATAAEKRAKELEEMKAALETPETDDDKAILEAKAAELEAQVAKDEEKAAAKAEAEKAEKAVKRVNLDEDLAKKTPTFATGIQAYMRELFKSRGK